MMPAMSIETESGVRMVPLSWMPMFSTVWAKVDTNIMAQTRPNMDIIMPRFSERTSPFMISGMSRIGSFVRFSNQYSRMPSNTAAREQREHGDVRQRQAFQPVEAQHERGQPSRQQCRPHDVDVMLRFPVAFPERQRQQNGDDADGEVDVEDRSPAEVLDEEAADVGPDDHGERAHGHHRAHGLAQLARWRSAAHRGQRGRHDDAAADGLYAPEGDQRIDIPREAAQERAQR